ncbi:MAG: UDP-N-acetylmuramoyl-L-alanyl-D-glutamate--2,6-diaminopimelate ligase [Planctomycetaceae bacterium]
MNANAISLQRLFPAASFVGCADVVVAGVSCDSRRVVPGDVFVALPGTRTDGHSYIRQAVAAGATAAIVRRPVSGLRLPQCVVDDVPVAYARLCMALAGNPQRSVKTAGITGTNGKTTTAFLLRSILEQSNCRCGLLGTVEFSDGLNSSAASMTTPTADVLAGMMSDMVRHGSNHCVMEVSSHALHQKRCSGLQLSAAAITNITQDHFDYHHTAENYRSAKAQIGTLLHGDAPLLLNTDDTGCRQLLQENSFSNPVISLGMSPDAELRAEVLSTTHRSQRIRLHLAQGDADVRLKLIGRHNVMNALFAAGLAEQLGIHLPQIIAGLERMVSIPGRLERIDEGQSFQVLVDYAHTPDALAHCLNAIRQFTPGRLICVFGAGGERDRSKRPLMAAAASAADSVVVTSDNPRSEDPGRIIEDVIRGFPPGCPFECEVDRERAILNAFRKAEPGDVVLIAGKGHESTQTIGDRTVPFDDRVVARRQLHEVIVSGPLTQIQPVYSVTRSA